MDNYVFPAIFEPSEDVGYCVSFPDLPGCLTQGDTISESIYMAIDVLELHLSGLKEDNDEIPYPSPFNVIQAPTNSHVLPIRVKIK